MSFIILFSYIHIEYFDHIHPTSHTFTASTSQTIHLLCSCHFVKGLDIRYERKNMWYFSPLVWFIYLSMMIFSSIYFPKKWHNFILLYDWIIITNRHTHTYTHIHSLVDGQLSWFYCLAIINCAAINMDAEVALLHSESHSLRICPVVIWQNHLVALFLVFWGTFTLIPIFNYIFLLIWYWLPTANYISFHLFLIFL
jgi:hypothetical protein